MTHKTGLLPPTQTDNTDNLFLGMQRMSSYMDFIITKNYDEIMISFLKHIYISKFD